MSLRARGSLPTCCTWSCYTISIPWHFHRSHRLSFFGSFRLIRDEWEIEKKFTSSYAFLRYDEKFSSKTRMREKWKSVLVYQTQAHDSFFFFCLIFFALRLSLMQWHIIGLYIYIYIIYVREYDLNLFIWGLSASIWYTKKKVKLALNAGLFCNLRVICTEWSFDIIFKEMSQQGSQCF